MKKFLGHLLLALNLYAAFPSWYYNIKDVKKQKKAFVEIMLPLIEEENKKILELRKKIKEIFNDPYYLMDPYKVAFLANIAKKYRIKTITDKREFLKRIDAIPPSLALAQAAIESGWGKSRFVRVANNIFGHWEYTNKGVKPKLRYKNIKHPYSLRRFHSLEDSIAAYMLNLNRNFAYKKFRNLRYYYRLHHKHFNGIAAATTMNNYSQLKQKYVRMLINMIKHNHWQKYDK